MSSLAPCLPSASAVKPAGSASGTRWRIAAPIAASSARSAKARKLAGYARQGEGAGQVANAERQGDADPFAAQGHADVVVFDPRGRQCIFAAPCGQQRGDVGPAVERIGEERGVRPRAFQRPFPVGYARIGHRRPSAWPGR